MNFDEVFTAVAHKRLTVVDLPHAGSNQHELNGSAALRRFFSQDTPRRGHIEWTTFNDDSEPVTETGEYNFYDARARSASRTGRSEWRMYYRGEPLADAEPGDLLILARTPQSSVHALVFQRGSGWERTALRLFPIDRQTDQLAFVPEDTLALTTVDSLGRAIMDRLDIAFAVPVEENLKEVVLNEFGLSFPKTAVMGQFARARTHALANTADELLMLWLDEEERLFRALEDLIVSEKIESGFESVDEFLSFSLSVQNRRKSRMGHALEHHLAALFDLHGVRYDAQVRTEGNRTADFVFPGASEYRDKTFPAAALSVLAAKSTCKDRWPQVLADADRVPTKHLATLDTALSQVQLTDMLGRGIVPVIPAPLATVYGKSPGIVSLVDFISSVST